jgi:hypothetical protein
LKGDPHVLRKLDETKKLIRELKETLSKIAFEWNGSSVMKCLSGRSPQLVTCVDTNQMTVPADISIFSVPGLEWRRKAGCGLRRLGVSSL